MASFECAFPFYVYVIQQLQLWARAIPSQSNPIQTNWTLGKYSVHDNKVKQQKQFLKKA